MQGDLSKGDPRSTPNPLPRTTPLSSGKQGNPSPPKEEGLVVPNPHSPSTPCPPASAAVDLFSGQRAPLTHAMERLGCDCFHPFDIAFAPGLDILNDSHYRLLLRVACSGIVGAGWSAPPCKEYSRLKLRKPGPKALRTPEFMQGLPGLSDDELLRVSQSAEIHARSRRVIRCIREAAGEAGLEQPPSSMAWLEEDNITLLRELCAHCAHVAACKHCASFASIRTLASTCCHAPGARKSIAGLKQGSTHVSALTAEYPDSLAAALAALLQPFCTRTGICKASISDFANLLCEPVIHRRPPVCDGAGFNSAADHTNPKASSPFQDLVQRWQQYASQHDLSPRILRHLAQGIDSHPLTHQQQLDLADIAHKCLHPSCSQADCLLVTPGQPFRLNLLQAFAARTQDPDAQLTDLLKQGVPAGILDEIPSSMQWTQRQHDLDDDDLEGTRLLHCQGNWTQAERNPALQQLVEQEVANGWVKPFPAGRSAVAQHWPAGSAIGKLNIVTAEGKEPRLVLDSTVCNANIARKVSEKVSLPSNLDVHRTFSSDDAFGRWVALSLDFKAAHKSIKVQAKEHGCLLFESAGRLYHYVVCHFGAKFSAYWWQRAGGQLLRIVHALLATFSHRAWLYVDDLLALLCKHSMPQQVTVITFFLACINAPISWKKAQLGNIVTWCGWTLRTDLESSHLAIGKLLQTSRAT